MHSTEIHWGKILAKGNKTASITDKYFEGKTDVFLLFCSKEKIFTLHALD